MAEYEPLKSVDASLATSTTESRVLSDDELIEVEDFDSFKCYTPKEIESLTVTFTQSQQSYNVGEDVEAHFYAPASLYQMKPEDIVGICPMRKPLPFIKKSISECTTSTESNRAITDEYFGENDMVVKNATFKIPSLPAEVANEVYFQFCYMTPKSDIIGLSTPFRFHSNGSAPAAKGDITSLTTIEVSQTSASDLENIGENYDSMVMEKRDDDDFIVVRSQESFLKERVEHLTKSNTLLEYLIRSLEKDLSGKTAELQKIATKLDGEKANYAKVDEERKAALAELEKLARLNGELKQEVAQLKQLSEKERDAKSQLESELELAKQKTANLEDTFQNLQIGESELKNILKDKEEEIFFYKDMVANLKQVNDELNKKLIASEDKMLNLQSSLAKALNDYRAFQHEKERYQNYEMVLEENTTLRQRVQDLEVVKAKQANEIKTLEDELHNSVANFNNLDSKFQSEREANAIKEQKSALLVDKTKFELIEMHARLEQSRVEYANLYRKYRSLQKSERSKLEKTPSLAASLSSSVASIASTSVGQMATAPVEPVKEKMDDIDFRLQQLEREEDGQKSVATVVADKVAATELPANKLQESLLIDIETTSSQPQQQQQSVNVDVGLPPVKTTPKMIEAWPSAPPAPENKPISVPMPCIMCDQVIECRQREDGSGQMTEMVNHLESVHKQKMCPICSSLFDTRLPIFNTYFANHIQNHFTEIKYPNLNQN